MSLEAIDIPDTATLADQLARKLEEMIVSGELPPESVLRQEEISRRFDVSRTPVREAFRQLTALGLVSFIPNRGVRVRALDRNEWRQAALARAALEGLLAELAAERITDVELAELDRARLEFERLTLLLQGPVSGEERDAVSFAWVTANDDFHRVIARVAAAPLVEGMIDRVSRVFSGHTRWKPGSAADRLYNLDVKAHAAICAALAARSPAAARVLASDHVLESWHLLEEILDEAEVE